MGCGFPLVPRTKTVHPRSMPRVLPQVLGFDTAAAAKLHMRFVPPPVVPLCAMTAEAGTYLDVHLDGIRASKLPLLTQTCVWPVKQLLLRPKVQRSSNNYCFRYMAKVCIQHQKSKMAPISCVQGCGYHTRQSRTTSYMNVQSSRAPERYAAIISKLGTPQIYLRGKSLHMLLLLSKTVRASRPLGGSN